MQKNIVIIGAGIAGCSLAYFLAKTGWYITLIESEDDIAKGGSGNPVAAIYPKFMLNDAAYNDFMLKSFMHTTAWISELGLSQDNYRFDGAIEILDATYAQKLAYNLSRKNLCQNNFFSLINESILDIYKLKSHQSGLFFHQGGWVNPIALCQHLINHSHIKIITKQKITSIENSISNWIVKTEDQRVFSAHDIAICNAGFVNQFEPTSHLQIDAFRGQINWIDATTIQMPSIVTSDIGYLFPRIHDKHVFGATYALNDFTKELRLSDTKKNIASIKEIHPDFYKECLAQESISGRVAWRASTKDRKPYVGSVFDTQILKKMRIRELTKAHQLPWLKNLYIASGFGSRGFTWAPYCTFVLANLINDNLSQEDKKTLNYTNPERYRLKKMSLKKIANHIFEV